MLSNLCCIFASLDNVSKIYELNTTWENQPNCQNPQTARKQSTTILIINNNSCKDKTLASLYTRHFYEY
ncbi:hypothetical protein DERP_002292 [Dermatophagoides pteronyssinus]|uniref:Uncharacterized protein n=1 Tax=Dermatophagoides pteronyssinus TaxID=6956 RepID=A0ABQ8JHB2_DERPT|nr:hypothetical protein DERP_002292 [Dermatophagoides pteronyssinus]